MSAPQSAYNRLELRTERALTRLAERLGSGRLTHEAWEEKVYQTLIDRHVRAAALGRQRAGDSASAARADTLIGESVASSEGRFLQRFADDIAEGRYSGEDGSLDTEAIAARSRFYAARLLGTANEAFVEASGPEALVSWIMAGAEEHCPDCPDLAAGSPYPSGTLWTYPRGGDTACLFHCKCHLTREDGAEGFTPPGGIERSAP